MAIFPSTYFEAYFTLQNTDETPIDISTWTFEADIREQIDDVDPLFTVTTANGGLVIVDGPNGRLAVILTAEQTTDLEFGRVVFDITRTDASPGPRWLFRAVAKVRQSVTR